MAIRTSDQRFVRGETIGLRCTVRDQDGQLVNLTGATAYARVRPDPKAAPVISKSSPSTGIAIATQTGATRGQFTISIAAADTASLPVGDYVWDAWVVLATGERFAVVATSRLTLVLETTSLT